MFDKTALADIVAAYKQDFERIHKEEIHKWKAVQCFQDHWNASADDFASMLKAALGRTRSLLTSANHFPQDMILQLANVAPEAVRAMYIELFDESTPVTERIEVFTARADELHAKYGDAGKVHYQKSNAIAVYLFLHRPDKYFLYQYRKFKAFAEKIGYSNPPKKPSISDVQHYFDMCAAVLETVKQDVALQDMSKKRLSEEDYPDDALHILTEDIVYFGSKKAQKDGVFTEPHETLDTAGITALNPPEKQSLEDEFLAYVLSIKKSNGEPYSRDDSILHNRALKKAFAELISLPYPDIFYCDDSIEFDELESKIRSLPQFNEVNLREGNGRPSACMGRYKRFLQARKTKVPADVNYWWLTANPKIWNFTEIKVGEEIGYSLFNEDGNRRRVYPNFLDAKVGDLVIGYESTPVKKIVALCKISRENDGESLYFEKVEGLAAPLEHSAIKDIPELQQMEYLVNPRGSLFKLTKDEYELLLDLIREQNSLVTLNAVGKTKYTKTHFLKEVYLSENNYESLVSLLRHKKNIILHGAPGVGKTFAAKRLAYSMMGRKDEDRIKTVQFHQSYTYEDFIMGYKPNEDGFQLQTGIFYQFCKQAENHPDDDFFFIIDEINRGNLSKIFGELLMLIEKDYRGEKMTMAYNGLTFFVPKNLHIIGMMNTADRSLAMIDYALRRRFSFYAMQPAFRSDAFMEYQRSLANETFDDLIEVVQKLNRDIENDASLGKSFCIGHSYFCSQKECTDEWLAAVVEYDLIPMIEEYWFDEETKAQAWAKTLRGVLND